MENIQEVASYQLFTINNQVYTVGRLALIVLLLLVAFWLFRKSNNFLATRLKQSELPADMILLLQRIYVIIALIVLAMLVLDLLQVPLSAFAFVSGAIAIGVGFGAQNIINNFISGWILMWERPIRIGDFLEIGDAKGVVETINTRSTRIRRTDGVHMLVPNSQLLENMVVNWTLIDNRTCSIVRVGVAYGSPIRKVEELILRATDDHPDTLDDPKPVVVFEDFGDNALIFDSYFWIDAVGERDLRKVRSEVRFAISDLFDEAGIVIAFPQRDVHLDGKLELIQKES
ncbi:mechanosensitive ion channel [Gammaproteobacteria bacterium]|nr:mechanosensitive ion channel [Gammaproteobacteria bacterium]